MYAALRSADEASFGTEMQSMRRRFGTACVRRFGFRYIVLLVHAAATGGASLHEALLFRRGERECGKP